VEYPSVRILILEDHPFIALDLQSIVEGEGHIASVCGAIAAARRRLADGLDFAFLDVDVSDGKSYDFARLLRDRGIPFAFVSASRPSDLPAPLRDAPFIAKPFLEEVIVAALPPAKPVGQYHVPRIRLAEERPSAG
jgi:CheY-like chemotaxis protein